MTEELYDDEFEEFEEFEEDDSDDPEALEIEAVNAELEAFARQSYSRVKSLTRADWEAMGALVHEHGISAEQAFDALAEQEAEESFADLAARIAGDVGRELTESELDRLWEQNETAELRGEDHVDAAKALFDLDSGDGRAEYIGERLEAPREHAEPSAVQVGDDGDERPSFNYENRAEREEAINRAMSGEPTAIHDSTFATEPEENE